MDSVLILYFADTTSGPTAIMALLTGEIVTDLSEEGYEGHIIATSVAFMCGLYGLAVGLLKLGFLLDFIPVPVLSGYVSAAALTIIIQQIPPIFAETATADSVAEYIREIFQKLPTTKWRDFLVGFTGIVLLCGLQYVGRKWGKNYRALWFLSICRNAMILIIFTGMSYGVNKGLEKPLFKISKTTGTGILTPTIPDTQLAGKLAGRAVAVFLAAALEHLAIGKAFGRRHGYAIDQSQELLYIGVANFVGGFFSAMPITGGFSRTAVNSESGVKSPLSGLVTAACVLVSIYKLSGAFYWIPKATLSAIIITAVWPIMLSPKVFYKYWKTSLSDFVGSMIAFWVTLFTSVEYGIAAAVAYSLVYVLLRITFARVVHVTPQNISAIYAPIPCHPVPLSESIAPGTQVFQINEAILFPNAYQIKNAIIEKIRNATRALPPDELEKSGERLWNQPRPSKDERILPSHSDDLLPLLREIIIDVRGVNYIDITGTQALHDLKAELQSHAGQRIRFVFVGMTPSVKTTLERTGWSLVRGEGGMRDDDGNLGPVRTKSSEGSERIRDGGDVNFDFIHSALYETSVASSRESSGTQLTPREDAVDKVGSLA